MSVAHIYTVAFAGIEAREVVQIHMSPGGGATGVFNVVGLADKAVAESRERVRAALNAIGLALPIQRITVNLAPADLPKVRLLPNAGSFSARCWILCASRWRPAKRWSRAPTRMSAIPRASS